MKYKRKVTITFLTSCSSKEINRAVNEEIMCELENLTSHQTVELTIKPNK